MKHFENEAALLFSFLDPQQDQTTWELPMRQKALDLFLKHATGDCEILTQEVGQFILREGPFKVSDKDVNAASYWKSVAVMAPRLAKVALRVLSIAPSEASVERSFKRGSWIFWGGGNLFSLFFAC